MPPLLALYGNYEVAFTEYLRTALQPGMTFVDVGANIGLFSVIAAQIVGPTGRVIAYEPNPEVFGYLARNVATNWFADRVVLVEKAAHRDGDTRRLNVLREFKGGGSIEDSQIVREILTLTEDVVTRRWHSESEWQRVDVACERLDHALADVEFLHLVKIDTEGGEAAVIDGMAGLLDDRRVGVISFEFRDDLLGPELQQEMRRVLLNLVDHGARFAVPEDPGGSIPFDTVSATGHYSQLLAVLP